MTYRTISYYLDDRVLAKMSQPAAAPAPAAAQPAATPAPQAQTQAAVTRPQPANLTTPANTNPFAQPKPTPTPAASASAAKQPARNTAAPLLVASLDKAAVPAPNVAVPVGASTSAPAASGPAVSADGEAPAVPFRSGPLKPISGGILNGKAINLPTPTYPEAAKRARIGGMVEVEVVIDINGKVISAKAVRGPGLLQTSAEMAARLARFTPTLLSGQPVKVAGVITYNFNLQQ